MISLLSVTTVVNRSECSAVGAIDPLENGTSAERYGSRGRSISLSPPAVGVVAAIGVEPTFFELFDAGHMAIEYRYPLALRHLAQRLTY